MKNDHLLRPFVLLTRTAAENSEALHLKTPVRAAVGMWGSIEYRFDRDRAASPLHIHRYDGLCDRRGCRRFYLGRHWTLPSRATMFLRSEWAALHGDGVRVLYDSGSNALCPRPKFDMTVPWAEPSDALWPALAEFGENQLPVFVLDRIGEVDPDFWNAITAPADDTVRVFLKEKNK